MPGASLFSPVPFPPPHSVRVSHRAKRVSLRVLPGKGLEVVVPLHADPACVSALLGRHRGWIERTLRRMRETQLVAGAAPGVPGAFAIKGGAERIRLVPVPGSAGRTLCEVPAPPPGRAALACEGAAKGRELTRSPKERFLVVPEESEAERGSRLGDWVRAEAARWLLPMLETMAASLGVRYASTRFRFQKSRWGSCSLKGNINLNACLLFLPEKQARYILLHELCHLRQMNHSEAFWKLVFAADPDALSKDRAMRMAWRHVPGWIWRQRSNGHCEARGGEYAPPDSL